MWRLTVRSPDSEPLEVDLKPGTNSVGRLSANDVTVRDISASRRHAEIIVDALKDTATIHDLDSTNGTFVNRQRIVEPTVLQTNDVIRIGQVTINVSRIGTGSNAARPITGTHPFDREILLESLDQHAILLYEVSRQLNTVINFNDALKAVSKLIRQFMGVDGCEIILAEQFKEVSQMGPAQNLLRQALLRRSAEVAEDLSPTDAGGGYASDHVRAAMCVPVLSGEDTLAILYIYRTGKNARIFEQRDLQLAIAISHQTALTLQRMHLLQKVRKEEQVHQLLRRFVPPQDAENLLQDYMRDGQLPELKEQKVTVLFSDIADSTLLAERFGANHFAKTLNKFYREASETVFRHGGTIRFLGDGIMAVFQGSEKYPEPEVSAARAGLEIVEQGRSTGQLSPDQRVVIGVSINTGSAMVGYVGTSERAEFTVLGDTVNVAFRMQEHARPYRVLVGPATMAAIVGNFQTQRIGEVSLRGREKSIQIYEVLPVQTLIFQQRNVL
ncbi:MAG: adenylate/guanylate cyclase domain-containing protein [Chloroflexota bacterium]